MSEKIIYTGHFVEDPKVLLQKIPSRIQEDGAKTYAHHLTREFRPKNGLEDVNIGKRRTLLAIGEVAAEGVHAVLVQTPDGEKITVNEYPHITIATAPNIAPSKSNDVIKAALEAGTVIPIQPPVEIDTIEGFFNGAQDVKS